MLRAMGDKPARLVSVLGGKRTLSEEHVEEPLAPYEQSDIPQQGESNERPFHKAEINLAPAFALRKLNDPNNLHQYKVRHDQHPERDVQMKRRSYRK
jgi:hypothetical protein